ncbi:hypothetical protein, partial [Bacillus thuringiensis]|uniref:hypothetical protein n=1 Tax=Bacillus thuringiensis TaxID=1428 RepID=UPI001C92D0E6
MNKTYIATYSKIFLKMSSTSKYLALKRSYKTQKRRVILTRLKVAWQRPTLTGTRSQLPSALESLTSV